MTISRSRADRAGDLLRKLPEHGTIEDKHVQAFIDLGEWRGMHADVLVRTTMGLRSAIQTACDLQPHGRVVSRLKKEGQILRKLWRGDAKRLSTVRDIAGCRAIVDNLDQAYRLADRITGHSRRLEQIVLDDKVQTPSELGYHALHLYAKRDGRDVEIQIRTVRNHDWAERVERYDRMTGEDAKHGEADVAVVDALRQLGHDMARLDKLAWGEIPRNVEVSDE